jgi:hypothetical protein
MKTPMQQIKEVIENALWDHPNVHELIVNWIDDNMAELMLTEREIIEDAFLHGCHSVPDDGFPISAKDYYNENFNNKEK